MARARLFIHFGPESLDPRVLGWPYPLEPAVALVASEVTDRRADGRAAARADAPVRSSASNGWFAWRMVGPNNRELGRSAATFAAYPECRAAVVDLQVAAGDVVVAIVSDPATGRWSWRADLDTTSVAMCARWYARERECRGSADRFRESVAIADLVSDITTLRDRRRLDAQRLSAEGRG